MPKIYFEQLRPDLDIPKPTPSAYGLPDWWKNMDRYTMHNFRRIGTVKNCPGISDIMYSGYTFYLPTNIYVDASGPYIKYEFENFGLKREEQSSFILGGHVRKQTAGYEAIEDFHLDILKIQTFWGVRTEKGYSTIFTHPWHRMELPFLTSSAIVDTDNLPTRSYYNFHFKRGFTGVIEKGTPMLQAFPYKRESWESEIVEPDVENMKEIDFNLKKISPNPYKRIYWQRKKYV